LPRSPVRNAASSAVKVPCAWARGSAETPVAIPMGDSIQKITPRDGLIHSALIRRYAHSILQNLTTNLKVYARELQA
jgi:hypothetical protein